MFSNNRQTVTSLQLKVVLTVVDVDVVPDAKASQVEPNPCLWCVANTYFNSFPSCWFTKKMNRVKSHKSKLDHIIKVLSLNIIIATGLTAHIAVVPNTNASCIVSKCCVTDVANTYFHSFSSCWNIRNKTWKRITVKHSHICSKRWSHCVAVITVQTCEIGHINIKSPTKNF